MINKFRHLQLHIESVFNCGFATREVVRTRSALVRQRTGLESALGPGATGTYEYRHRAGPASTQPPDASARVATELHANTLPDLPSAIPSFLEACAKLAAEATARGDIFAAREAVEKAARVASLVRGTNADP